MNVFLMHVGHTNRIDIDYTIKRSQTIAGIRDALSPGTDEHLFFSNDKNLHSSFPSNKFNCWGVPVRAKPAFDQTNIGDLVLFAPWIGVHAGGIYHIGIIRAICRSEARNSSRLLWPETPDQRFFPWIYFFEAEHGYRNWYSFLDDVGIKHGWNPRGWYKKLESERFAKFGGAQGYHHFLQSEGFSKTKL